MANQGYPMQPRWSYDEIVMHLDFFEAWSEYMEIKKKLIRIQKQIFRNARKFDYYNHFFSLLVFGQAIDGPSIENMREYLSEFLTKDQELRNEQNLLQESEAYLCGVLQYRVWWNQRE